MKEVYDFLTCRRKIWIDKLLNEFYLYIYNLCIQMNLNFDLSKEETYSFIEMIHDELEIKSYSELYRIMDIYVCYLIVTCDSTINIEHMRKSLGINKDRLLRAKDKYDLIIVEEGKGNCEVFQKKYGKQNNN